VRRLEVVLFVLGLSAMAYFYGVASTKRQWFPTTVVEDGWLAAKALKEVWDSEADHLPPGAIELADAEPIHRPPGDLASTQAPAPPEELLLIPGGPFQLMEFCPELGCLAWLMDRRGTIYHAWPLDPAVEWGDSVSAASQDWYISPTGGHVYGNGDLLVVFQGHNTFPFGVGIARFDRNGKLLWKKEINAHHWFDLDDQGRIYLATHRLVDSPLELADTDHQLTCEDEKIYEDFIAILDPDGNVIDEFSLYDVFIDSGYVGLLERTRGRCDPLHLNDVRVLKAEDADGYPEFAVGDIMVSTNAVNTVAVIDPRSRRIKWLTSGTTVAQHSPRFAGDNRILVFDNRGGARIDEKGGSQIVSIDVASGVPQTVFPKPEGVPSLDFYSHVAGHIDLDRGSSRALISLYDQGRILEVDLVTGEVLWEYTNVHDIGGYQGSEDGDGSPTFALFGINSADYVARPAFLTKPVVRLDPCPGPRVAGLESQNPPGRPQGARLDDCALEQITPAAGAADRSP
jgi:Arylsulfotransferase (ASST)